MLIALANASNRIDPIYWRIDNHQFQAVRHVKFEDKMDIFCPEVSTNQNPETVSSSHHYQTIHLVDKDAYDTCTLNGSEQYVMKCDTPHKEKKFTLMFRRVNPSPFGFEFSEGSYYLISTSNGNAEGQDQKFDGVCSSHNMKVKFDVRQGEEETVEQIDLPDRSISRSPSSKPRVPDFSVSTHDSDYTVYQTEPNGKETETGSIETEMITEKSEKIVGTVSTAIIVGIVFFVFIMFLLVVAFVLFKRTSAKSKSSNFNPSTMSDYTIGGKGAHFGQFHDSYQDHVTSHPIQAYDYSAQPTHGQPTHIVPFIQSPADYGSKIVTLYPKTNQTMNQSQPVTDFTYRPVTYAQPDLTANHSHGLPEGEIRLSERSNQTVLV